MREADWNLYALYAIRPLHMQASEGERKTFSSVDKRRKQSTPAKTTKFAFKGEIRNPRKCEEKKKNLCCRGGGGRKEEGLSVPPPLLPLPPSIVPYQCWADFFCAFSFSSGRCLGGKKDVFAAKHNNNNNLVGHLKRNNLEWLKNSIRNNTFHWNVHDSERSRVNFSGKYGGDALQPIHVLLFILFGNTSVR